MKSSLLVALLIWQIARPGYQYSFPRDFFNHPEYQTEWWYYTGNVRAADGHQFGFELTFFRSALKLPPDTQEMAPVWRPTDIYIAHLALSDLTGKNFYHRERMNRAGPGLAGASEQQHLIWNGNWQVNWTGTTQNLRAITEDLQLQLQLVPEKPVVIQGENGISIKGPRPDEASHYMSFTRLRATGGIRWRNQNFSVTGLAWMDHEFFSEDPDPNLLGWDWFSIQLDDGDELMLYRVRRKQTYSSGTFIDTRPRPVQFDLHPNGTWNSYPMDWDITVPALGLHLRESTKLENQELSSKITPGYWEGAVDYNGTQNGRAVHGVGYLEMTGYGHSVWLGQPSGESGGSLHP